jgi:hypothetical protein
MCTHNDLMKPQHRNKKLNGPAARTAPEIPSHIRHASVAADILAGSEISFRDQIVENVCSTPINPSLFTHKSDYLDLPFS